MLDDNFIEKMMELGIGMSIMSQMPNMMGGCMSKNMGNTSNQSFQQIPPSMSNNTASTYIAVNGQQAGPLSEEELKLLEENKMITDDTLVWTPQMTQWTPAKLVPAVSKLLMLASVRSSVSNPMQSTKPMMGQNSIKDEVIAALEKLGYKNAVLRQKVETVVSEHPNLTSNEVLKIIIQTM